MSSQFQNAQAQASLVGPGYDVLVHLQGSVDDPSKQLLKNSHLLSLRVWVDRADPLVRDEDHKHTRIPWQLLRKFVFVVQRRRTC